MWQEKPAIVVAAGPSLDNNVGQLQAVQNQSVIIAVDTAYKTLLQHEIHPHFVVTTDPTELNRKHFENIEPSSDTILVFDPEVYYTNTQNWRFRQVFINLDKSAFTRWIEHSLGPYGCQMKGGSVGHTAYFVARDLGADPIIFIGLDLAFNLKAEPPMPLLPRSGVNMRKSQSVSLRRFSDHAFSRIPCRKILSGFGHRSWLVPLRPSWQFISDSFRNLSPSVRSGSLMPPKAVPVFLELR